MTKARPVLLALLLGLIGAQVFTWLHTPLPWLIGPLFVTALVGLAGTALHCPVPFRQAGQWAIGTVLGLYFTAPVLQILLSNLSVAILSLLFSITLGAFSGWLLYKIAGIDRTTGFFAMALGGASEMATQAERYGANIQQVAAAHSVRVVLVVFLIPFVFQLSGVHGQDLFLPGSREVVVWGLLILVILTCCGGMLLTRLGVANAWVIGPMLVAICLTAFGVRLSAMPEWVMHLSQLFIGISLGTRFTPAFLRTAPRFLFSVLLCCLITLTLAAGFGYFLGWISQLHPATVILAMAPGGIAEMSLTAKNLQLGVPVVTAFHVMRMVGLVMLIGPLFRAAKKIEIAIGRR